MRNQPRGSLGKPRDAFDLHFRPERQAVRAQSRARRQALGREISHIDLVELGPFRHIGEHHGAFDDVGEVEPAIAQHRADILHRLPRLSRHAARRQRHRARQIAERPRKIERLACPHGRAEGKPEGFRVGSLEDFHQGPSFPESVQEWRHSFVGHAGQTIPARRRRGHIPACHCSPATRLAPTPAP